MNILDKIFPRRNAMSAPLQSDEIAAAIERHRGALAAAKARIEAAVAKRAAALEALDEAGMAAADAETAAAGRAVEVANKALEALEGAYGEQVKVEQREALKADVAAASREADAVAAMIQAEYPNAAATLAAIFARLADYRTTCSDLNERARLHGERIALPDPQDFRAAPRRWKASWPNPEGAHLGRVYGSPEDAPRGSIRWSRGEPHAARDDVTVEPRAIEQPKSLLDAIPSLPALRLGEADHWPPAGAKTASRGYVDTSRPTEIRRVSALAPRDLEDRGDFRREIET